MAFWPNHYEGCRNSHGGLDFRWARGPQPYEIYNFSDFQSIFVFFSGPLVNLPWGVHERPKGEHFPEGHLALPLKKQFSMSFRRFQSLNIRDFRICDRKWYFFFPPLENSMTPPLILLFWAARPQVGALGALFGHFGAPWNPWNCSSSIPLWNVRISRFCCFQASKDLGKKGHKFEFTDPLIALTQNWWVWVWNGSLWTFETEPPGCTLLTLYAALIKHSHQTFVDPS